MIIGTAGHIDHGKTSLVRALTGVDTDRLKEEKERGISIELGYAYTPLPNGGVLGFVDVPGHERLIHTMVAGACGIDFALLVVAADDGVMPQTREHLAILELLGVGRGAVALTKVDRVRPERVREAEAQVRALLHHTALASAPIFPVNAVAPDDPGAAALRKHLHEAAAALPARSNAGLFRLAVDRVFTLPGHGTIVAGTVFSGRVHVGDNLIVMPGSAPARVRSIHAENRASDDGVAGQRCALNLAGIEKSAISRGDWLGDPRVLVATKRVDARVHLLAHSERKLSPGTSVHVHIGAAHALAHLMLLESEHLTAGESARAQLVFETAICALPGDRFIVRDAQAAHTIGGGVVLDSSAPSRKRRSEQRLRYLDAVEKMLAGHGLSQLLADAPNGVALADLERLTGHNAASVILPVGTLLRGTKQEQFAILEAAWETLRDDALRALREFHTESPDDPGPDSGRLRRITRPDLPAPLWAALVDELTHDGSMTRHGPWLQLPDHAASLSESDRELARQLQSLIAQARPEPPWVRDLASAVRQPEERVRQVLRRQVACGTVCQIVHDLFYDSDRVDTLAGVVASLAREQGSVDAASYRDAIGLGRKRSIQILEFFDRVGYTRRVHDVHVLRKDSGWNVQYPH
ncbi:selenocysteine-specific translation elongation factor [Steroidobacter agaridevorans]|uniref:selenocysteine-specific translation elongation factor n=1 Tax=Steroidobacter agaridevorans TaxID=2695856 RepID=UPI00132B2915|nr:selenocysteine-specific translation elongation factor [Steroidobacter agaridevorans]GFE91809.1 selenocysteine-specific translation factor [Steroidobacter agaridevorans]